MRIAIALMFFVLPLFHAHAADKRPSENSLKELFEVTDVRKISSDVQLQMESMLRKNFQQQFSGRQLTPAQQRIVDDTQAKVIELLRREVGWDAVSATYVRIYQEALTQEDVDAWIAFYRTPAGQAYVKKMPVLTQLLMKDIQGRLPAIQAKVVKIQQEMIEQLKVSAK